MIDYKNCDDVNSDLVRKVRLAKYKYLSLVSSDVNELNLLAIIEKLLLNDGFTKEELQLELDNYRENEFLNREAIIRNRVKEIILEITEKLKFSESINTSDYPIYYYKIQEVVAMDSKLGAKLLKEAFERASIEYAIWHSEGMYGDDLGNYTYYFERKKRKRKSK